MRCCRSRPACPPVLEAGLLLAAAERLRALDLLNSRPFDPEEPMFFAVFGVLASDSGSWLWNGGRGSLSRASKRLATAARPATSQRLEATRPCLIHRDAGAAKRLAVFNGGGVSEQPSGRTCARRSRATTMWMSGTWTSTTVYRAVRGK